MKKIILVLLSLIVIIGISIGGIFAIGKYKEFNDLKDQVELNNNSNNKNEEEIQSQENNQQENNIQEDNTQNNAQKQNQPQEDTHQEEKVNRNNVFDYIIYCIEDNGRDKNDYSFNEPEYDPATGNWTVYAGNRGGAGGGYTFYVNQRGDVNVVESNSSEEIYSTYDINLN